MNAAEALRAELRAFVQARRDDARREIERRAAELRRGRKAGWFFLRELALAREKEAACVEWLGANP